MASRKNRSRKANRKSPQLPPGLGERLRQRFEGLFAWFYARRWVAIAAGALLLFAGSLVGGYWLAEHLSGGDSERLAREEEPKEPLGASTRERIRGLVVEHARLDDGHEPGRRAVGAHADVCVFQ